MKKPVQDIRTCLIDLQKAAADYLFIQNTTYTYLEKILSQYREDDPDYPEEIDRILSTIDDYTCAVWEIQECCENYLERTNHGKIQA